MTVCVLLKMIFKELSMLIKKEKIEDLEFMDVEPDDEELREIVMKREDVSGGFCYRAKVV